MIRGAVNIVIQPGWVSMTSPGRLIKRAPSGMTNMIPCGFINLLHGKVNKEIPIEENKRPLFKAKTFS
jgi:hypothetical protein